MREFGLLGKTLSHSFSKKYFSAKFQSENIHDASYENFELEGVSDLKKVISSKKNLVGLNVTIPFKETVISELDEIEDTALKIGSVNTILVKKGRLIGYNTDITGFRESLKPFLAKEHTRALIFGTGGASKAVAFVLNKLEIPFYYVSRQAKGAQSITYDELDETNVKSFKLLINCTPIGMFPNINETLPLPIDGITEKHLVYDLIYNPEETLLLKNARKRGAITVNGLSMLKIQAEASWNIWNDQH